MFPGLDVFALYHDCSIESFIIFRGIISFYPNYQGLLDHSLGFEQVLNYHLIMSVSNIESIHDGNDGLN